MLKRLGLSCLLTVGLGLAACQKQVEVEPQAGREHLVETARLFVSAFLSGHQDEVLRLSGMPFLLDNRAILGHPAELEQLLNSLYYHKKLPQFQLLALTIRQPADLENMSSVWAKLLEYGFSRYAYVEAQILVHPDTQERILLILKPDQGRWLVVGYVISRL